MADARGAWNETGDKLGELGRKLKAHYDGQHGPDGQAAKQELADAARRVGGAVQDAFEALGAAARDADVQSDVKQVGRSLVDALGATLGQASEEVRKAFAERRGEPGPDAATPAEPAAPTPAPGGPPSTTGVTGTTPPDAGPDAAPGPGETPRVEPWGTP